MGRRLRSQSNLDYGDNRFRDQLRDRRHGSRTKARCALTAAFGNILSLELEDRVLPFDAQASRCAADIAARRRMAGRPVDFQDTEIAGIAVAHGAAIATRNVGHFDDLDVEIVNPWA